MPGVKVGIIGGTGMSNPDILMNAEDKAVDTPFGKPSDVLKVGEIAGVPCVVLSRHARCHTVMPTNVRYRANLWALKEEGCTHVVVTTACGSLQENIKPGDIVVLDQFIDRTQKRIQTFYDGQRPDILPGICHLPLAEPFCTKTRKILYECAREENITCHESGTILTIEGPRFSSKAESKLWHSWGAHCVNMTTVPEVILAKELGLCYASLALVTDYDSWKDNEESVSVEGVMKTFQTNSKNAGKVLMRAIPKIAKEDWTEILKTNTNICINHGSMLCRAFNNHCISFHSVVKNNGKTAHKFNFRLFQEMVKSNTLQANSY